ncbi:MAG: hypothetical protein FJ102_05625 [Deltaproteobacteria bacterium]|nr:hypothetical protein [Deltaproteobacteria bacterium]
MAHRRGPDAEIAERARTIVLLHEAGVQMMRLRLRREFPGESRAEIEARLRAWLRAPEPVPEGMRVVPWPRR